MEVALARLRLATKRRADAENEWCAAIVSAYSEGVPIRKVGEAAGVSHVRVIQIAHSRQPLRNPWSARLSVLPSRPALSCRLRVDFQVSCSGLTYRRGTQRHRDFALRLRRRAYVSADAKFFRAGLASSSDMSAGATTGRVAHAQNLSPVGWSCLHRCHRAFVQERCSLACRVRRRQHRTDSTSSRSAALRNRASRVRWS